ncbi:unnamed protein product, partial [Ectocarpus sp. 8 AP-2014]
RGIDSLAAAVSPLSCPPPPPAAGEAADAVVFFFSTRRAPPRVVVDDVWRAPVATTVARCCRAAGRAAVLQAEEVDVGLDLRPGLLQPRCHPVEVFEPPRYRSVLLLLCPRRLSPRGGRRPAGLVTRRTRCF